MLKTITIPKSILSDPDYLTERFSRPAAWVDLLLLADDERKVHASFSALATRWRWSVNRVKRYLSELTRNGVVDTFYGTFHGKNSENIIIVHSNIYEQYRKDTDRNEAFPPSSPLPPSSLPPTPPYSSSPLPPSSPLEESSNSPHMGACAHDTRVHDARTPVRAEACTHPPTPFPKPFILSSAERDAVRMGLMTVVDCKRKHLAENLKIFASEIEMTEAIQDKFLDWWCSPCQTNAEVIRAESDTYFNLRCRAMSWMERERRSDTTTKKTTSRAEAYVNTTQSFVGLVNEVYQYLGNASDGTADSPDEQ